MPSVSESVHLVILQAKQFRNVLNQSLQAQLLQTASPGVHNLILHRSTPNGCTCAAVEGGVASLNRIMD